MVVVVLTILVLLIIDVMIAHRDSNCRYTC